MGLRFICLLSALPFAKRRERKMKCVNIMEERAREAVKVVKAVVFRSIEQERAERARAD
jgi:hypothetical protein